MYIKQSLFMTKSWEHNVYFPYFKDSLSPVMKKGIYAVFSADFDMLEI